MKTKRSLAARLLSLVLAALLVLGALPLSAAAKADPVQTGSFHYVSQSAEAGEPGDTFFWSDAWFKTDGRTQNPSLATLSATAALTATAYYPGNRQSDVSQRDKYVRELLEKMAFTDLESNAWYTRENLPNSACCTLARKTLQTQAGPVTLVAVLPLSAAYQQEWAGNFTVGTEGLHEGFQAGRDEILRFLKSYLTAHGVTGSVKLWIAGHSRGGALSNLLGAFFAAGGDAYLGDDVTVRPEDLYCYTFAAPGTVQTAGVTKAELLAVSAARTEAPYSQGDTPGAAWSYTGADGGTLLRPVATLFAPVHNCRPDNDLIPQLPPTDPGWDFTVFGPSFALQGDGSAETRTAMLEILQESSPTLYESYTTPLTVSVLDTGSTGDDSQYGWKRLSVSDRAVVDLPNAGELTMAQMMRARAHGLAVVTRSRADYPESQPTFTAAMGAFGMAFDSLMPVLEERVSSLSLSDLTPVTDGLKAGLDNYMAYVSHRLGGDDGAAAAHVLLGVTAYAAGRTSADPAAISISDFLSLYAKVLTDTPALLAVAPALLPDSLGSANWRRVTFPALITEASSSSSFFSNRGKKGIYTALSKVSGEEDPAITAAIDGGKGSLLQVMQAFVPALLKKAGLTSLAQKADASLVTGLNTLEQTAVAQVQADGFSQAFVDQLQGHFAVLREDPALVRNILCYTLCYTGETYDCLQELNTLVTFLTQVNKVFYAHICEMYLFWLRAQDPAYTGGEPTPPENPFVDVPEGEYYYAPVLWAVSHDPQITNGVDDTHFQPGKDCTRGQVVTFLWRAEGCPEPTRTTHPFTDVKESGFYYTAMLWAVERGITTGKTSTTFAPGATCSRAEVVTFLHRAQGKPAPTGAANPFTDVKETGFYYTAMRWAVEQGVTKGLTATTFGPGATCTRGQIVTFLYRAMA